MAIGTTLNQRFAQATVLLLGAGMLVLLGCGLVPGTSQFLGDNADDDQATACASGAATVPLKEAKLNIEHNATDADTGFQGFIDSEGWDRLDVTGPDGVVLTLQSRGNLEGFGVTELFFETVEPANADVPLADVLALLPEGEYTISGPTPDGECTLGTALLTHSIPAGPVLLTPPPAATVARNNLVMSWSPVTQTIIGEPVTIIRYQLIVEKDDVPHAHAIGKIGLSIYVPATVTSVTVPVEILEASTAYKWEVLAIEESGNQTLSSSEFTTE
ncbi:MAG: hypothetical protein ACKVS9_04795 [Phycisphaerae bacterium]